MASIVITKRDDSLAGWVVEEIEEDPARQEAKEKLRLAGFPLPFDVQTIIKDENWCGPVRVGAKVVTAPCDGVDGLRKFRCVDA